jgi:transcriptional regulator with XRE-family HTH domain
MGELERLERESAERVAAICAREGITRRELAAALGVAPSTLWRWASALASPPPEEEAALRGLYAGRLQVRGGRVVKTPPARP